MPPAQLPSALERAVFHFTGIYFTQNTREINQGKIFRTEFSIPTLEEVKPQDGFEDLKPDGPLWRYVCRAGEPDFLSWGRLCILNWIGSHLRLAAIYGPLAI